MCKVKRPSTFAKPFRHAIFSGRHTLKAAMTVRDLQVTLQHSLTVHHDAY